MSGGPSGPLVGLRVVEFASIGPGPHCAMLLADLGADVVRIDRPGGSGRPNPVLDRGRATLVLDIGTQAGRERAAQIVGHADVLIEGFRPGVMERLGLGPEPLMALNPRLVFGRMTGWGQTGPLAHCAGHDINYIAVTGALAAMGRAGEPASPPLNLVGDFGGGSMFLAFGVMAALWERQRSGRGQVIDAAMIDGVSSMMAMFTGFAATGAISLDRDRNLLGGAAPFYRCYACADGREIAIGSIEAPFYRQLLERAGIAADGVGADGVAADGVAADLLQDQLAPETWPERSEHLAAVFRSRPRDEWCALLEGTDACFAPVLTLEEAPHHPQMAARKVYAEHQGLVQHTPGPRFSRTPGAVQPDRDAQDVIASWTRS